MALVAAEQEKKKGSSPIIQLLALLAATAVAAGIGWYAGNYLHTLQQTASGSEEKQEDAKAGAGTTEAKTITSPRIVALEPITTNLADPQDVWVRMELALVFKDEPSPILAQRIHQDLLAYARTLKLRQIETPSGFQHLKADLRERAGIRSEGRITDVLVTTLLYE